MAGSGLLSLKITVLGSGTSHGVPMIGCDCAVCRSDRSARPALASVDSHRRPPADAPTRRRSPPHVRSILVDTSTDLRAQALTHDHPRVDAILFTHSHADHVMGLDEVRRFNVLQKAARCPCFADAQTLADLRQTFALHLRRTDGAGRRRAAAGAVPGSAVRSRSAASRSCRCRCCTAGG